MDGLQVFNNSEFGQLDVLIINGKEYFPATACAKMLGYVNPKDAIRRHCRWGVKHDLPHPQNPQKVLTMNFIPEGDLYRLIVGSKLPDAEKFERWIFDEVVPFIRRQGAYMPDVTKIIVPIVEATVSEVIKQIGPMIRYMLLDEEEPYRPACETMEHRRRKKTFSTIEKLEPSLRWEVDQMLLSDRYSYLDVKRFLESRGIRLSQTAICTYYNKMRLWDV